MCMCVFRHSHVHACSVTITRLYIYVPHTKAPQKRVSYVIIRFQFSGMHACGQLAHFYQVLRPCALQLQAGLQNQMNRSLTSKYRVSKEDDGTFDTFAAVRNMSCIH